MPARQSGSPRQQCSGVISAFVDSIDSHIDHPADDPSVKNETQE